MKRRQFLARLLGALALAPAAACYVSDSSDSRNPAPAADAGAGPGAAAFMVTNTDSSGHSHSFMIQCAHRGADGWTYTAGGGHSHQVILDRQQLAAVFAGETVTVETSGSHPHTWVIQRPATECS